MLCRSRLRLRREIARCIVLLDELSSTCASVCECRTASRLDGSTPQVTTLEGHARNSPRVTPGPPYPPRQQGCRINEFCPTERNRGPACIHSLPLSWANSSRHSFALPRTAVKSSLCRDITFGVKNKAFTNQRNAWPVTLSHSR